ncbi:polyketide synthase dehydratase domain-containing protein [Kitasatospora arboriphila]
MGGRRGGAAQRRNRPPGAGLRGAQGRPLRRGAAGAAPAGGHPGGRPGQHRGGDPLGRRGRHRPPALRGDGGARQRPGDGAQPPDPGRAAAAGGGRDAGGFYADGTLFHGAALQGVRRVLAEDESRLVLECALPEPAAAAGAFAGSLYRPGTTDLLLQAGLVWMRLFRATASLPLSVARVELHRAPADGETFLAVVEPASVNGTSASLTVTAVGHGGRVLARLSGVSLVSTPQLAAKFARS